MSDTVIQVDHLSKRYRIGLKEQQAKTLAGSIKQFITAPSRNLKRLVSLSRFGKDETDDIFWALRDVSFEVKQGETLGIIGRNGAGKSTLLKILSRITDPTGGQIRMRGRVASLLEVGTGFNPELTGRENIYMNGTILGMRKTEIDRKFDEIVEFAGVEKFIDTPVKRYSSGMGVRLGFAVAAHLEPEILIVDEVLAVGDAEFQKKCLGKMGDVARSGRTVLFVSHNMAAVENLCRRAILLEKGMCTVDSTTRIAFEKYLQGFTKQDSITLAQREDRQGTGDIRFVSIVYQNKEREQVTQFTCGRDAIVLLFYQNNTHQDLRNIRVGIGIDNKSNQRITFLSNETTGCYFSSIPSDVHCIELYIPRIPLTPGKYQLTIYCEINGVVADWIQNAGTFEVGEGDYYGTGRLPHATQGDFLIDHQFRII